MKTLADSEPIETQALAVVDHPQPPATGLFGTTEPVAVVEKAKAVANALKDVISKQGLISKISNKEYPRCEAWTLLGTMLGVYPVLIWTHPVEGGWEARVEARTRDGAIVGAAEAQCLRGEKNWGNRDDFALRSMAQTRATAKCLRMPLGFVMTLAGYEATPAEEMMAEPAKTHPKASQTPKNTPPVSPNTKDQTDEEIQNRAMFLQTLEKQAGKPFFSAIERFLRGSEINGVTWLMPNETLADLREDRLRRLVNQWDSLFPKIEAWLNEHPEHVSQEPQTEAEADDLPFDEDPDDEWRTFPMPFGKHAGTVLGELDKKYLYGLWANYEVETEYNGKPKKQETIDKDQQFRDMLDQAGLHYEFTKKD